MPDQSPTMPNCEAPVNRGPGGLFNIDASVQIMPEHGFGQANPADWAFSSGFTLRPWQIGPSIRNLG